MKPKADSGACSGRKGPSFSSAVIALHSSAHMSFVPSFSFLPSLHSGCVRRRPWKEVYFAYEGGVLMSSLEEKEPPRSGAQTLQIWNLSNYLKEIIAPCKSDQLLQRWFAGLGGGKHSFCPMPALPVCL